MAGSLWPSQAMPYASAFTAPPALPMYMLCYMPRPSTAGPFCKLNFKELVWQCQDLEARELEVKRMTRTHNLSAVRDARVTTATYAAGRRNRHPCKHLLSGVLVPRLHFRYP